MHEYELTLIFRGEDDADAQEIGKMIEAVLKRLDHPVAMGGPSRVEPPLDPRDD
jgi:hypothetical protein